MLQHTFIHLPNHGSIRERALWEDGVKTWEDFLGKYSGVDSHKRLCKIIASSNYALKAGDANHFAMALPSNEAWRTFPHFTDVAYLDIETTGLGNHADHITVIGVYDGKRVRSYIYGQNLNEFAKDIREYDLLVTFNGSQFDLPFIRNGMKGIKLPRLHIDLRFLLSSLDVTGGLKKIEQKFGIEREDDLKGLNGYDAVKLWMKYVRNKDKNALGKLVRYNAADISNLKTLMEWAYNEKRKRTGFDAIP